MDTEEYVREWLKRERVYTLNKFGIEQDNRHIIEIDFDWWHQQLDNYLHRAKVLGLVTPGGRQALAKFVATSVGMLEACVRVYGELPEPGVSSGENLTKMMPHGDN